MPAWLQPWVLPLPFTEYMLAAQAITLSLFGVILPAIGDPGVPGPAQYRKAPSLKPGSRHHGAARVDDTVS
jgi:hypothetical protein